MNIQNKFDDRNQQKSDVHSGIYLGQIVMTLISSLIFCRMFLISYFKLTVNDKCAHAVMLTNHKPNEMKMLISSFLASELNESKTKPNK